MTDDEVLQKNAHIPTAEIECDLADTECEIQNMEREAEGYRLMTHDRMAQFLADARQSGIRDRQQFVEKLQRLLRLRKEQST